jgi:hypothetical protein
MPPPRPAPVFHRFRELPFEIQLIVWDHFLGDHTSGRFYHMDVARILDRHRSCVNLPGMNPVAAALLHHDYVLYNADICFRIPGWNPLHRNAVVLSSVSRAARTALDVLLPNSVPLLYYERTRARRHLMLHDPDFRRAQMTGQTDHVGFTRVANCEVPQGAHLRFDRRRDIFRICIPSEIRYWCLHERLPRWPSIQPLPGAKHGAMQSISFVGTEADIVSEFIARSMPDITHFYVECVEANSRPGLSLSDSRAGCFCHSRGLQRRDNGVVPRTGTDNRPGFAPKMHTYPVILKPPGDCLTIGAWYVVRGEGEANGCPFPESQTVALFRPYQSRLNHLKIRFLFRLIDVDLMQPTDPYRLLRHTGHILSRAGPELESPVDYYEE